MWAPLPPEPPPVGWWHELETAEQYETRRWLEGIADEVRAERAERLRARVHEVDMKLAGALSRDRWRRIQRRGEQRSTGSDGGDESESWRGLPVEHSPVPGRILSVTW